MKGVLLRLAVAYVLLPASESLLDPSFLTRYGRVETLTQSIVPGINTTGSFRYPPWSSSPNVDDDGFLKERYQRVRRYRFLPTFLNGNGFPELDCQVRQVPDDANCLFHAVALCHDYANSGYRHADLNDKKALSRLYENAAALRQEVVHCFASSMVQSTSMYLGGKTYIPTQKVVAAAAMYYSGTNNVRCSPQDYCRLMLEHETFAGGAEIVALSNLLECPINVYELAEQNSRFVLRRIHCFGSPKFDHNNALHILSADSRFPDLEPGEQREENNQFLALFPRAQVRERGNSELLAKKSGKMKKIFQGLLRHFRRRSKVTLPRSTTPKFSIRTVPFWKVVWNLSPNIDSDGFLRQIYERVPGSSEQDPVDDLGLYTLPPLSNEEGRPEVNGHTHCLVRQVPGDGSCLFYAISVGYHYATWGIHLNFNKTLSVAWLCQHAAELRQHAVHCLEASMNQEKLLYVTGDEFLNARTLVESIARDISGEEYCRLMKDERYWAGGPEIVALCNVLERPIHVYKLAVSPSPDDGDALSSPPRFVLRRAVCFGSPKFNHRSPLHILSADSRFPDLVPGQPRHKDGDHFLVMFPGQEYHGGI